jgi:hypothetical protein
VALGVGKSIVVDLPDDIKDVLVADPKIANAVVRYRGAPTSSVSQSDRPTFTSSMPSASSSWPSTLR